MKSGLTSSLHFLIIFLTMTVHNLSMTGRVHGSRARCTYEWLLKYLYARRWRAENLDKLCRFVLIDDWTPWVKYDHVSSHCDAQPVINRSIREGNVKYKSLGGRCPTLIIPCCTANPVHFQRQMSIDLRTRTSSLRDVQYKVALSYS